MNKGDEPVYKEIQEYFGLTIPGACFLTRCPYLIVSGSGPTGSVISCTDPDSSINKQEVKENIN